MARTHREPAVAELCQQFANRAFVQHDTKASLQFIPQIDPPPAHHRMSGWIGASLNQPDQFSLLLRCEFWFTTEGFQIVQATQAVGVIAMHPVPRSEEHTSELQSLTNLVCRLLLEKKK